MSRRYNDYRQVHVWIEDMLYDNAKALVDAGVYRSMSELVRDGINMALDKNAGYEEERRQEVISKFGPTDMMETRIKIDGTIMRLRIYARWWHLGGNNQIESLTHDLHYPENTIPMLEEKYGTKIELFNMHQVIPDKDDDYMAGLKETYAYKVEHGLIPPGAED